MGMFDSIRRFLGRACSWLGYLTIIAEPLFLVMLYFQAFVSIPVIKTVLFPKAEETPMATHVKTVTVAPSEPSWIVPLLAATAVLLLSYGIFRLVTKDVPEAKEKAEAAVEKIARQAIKKIEKDKKVSQKRERVLTVRLIFWLKISAALVPLCVVVVLQTVTMSISRVAALFIMSGLSLSAVVWFTLERSLYRPHSKRANP